MSKHSKKRKNEANAPETEWKDRVLEEITEYVPTFGRKDEITSANPNSSLRYYAQRVPYVIFGCDNLYPVRVLDNSTKNHNIARANNDFVAMLKNSDYTLATGQAKRLLQHLKIERLIERIAWDLIVLGGLSVQVCNYPDVLGKMRTIALNHVPFANVRMSKANKYNYESGYYVAEDWTAIDMNGNVRYYGGIDREAYAVKAHIPYSQGWNESLFVDFEPHPSSRYYPVADSECVFSQAEISGEAVKFHVSYLKNGIVGSILLTIPVPPMKPADLAKAKEEIVKFTEEQYMGAQQAGKPLVMLSTVDSSGMRQDPILSGFPQNGDDKRHLDLMKDVDAQTLFGLGYIDSSDGGNLGKAESMDMAYRLMEYNRVASHRKRIENFVNTIIRNNGIQDTFALPFTPPAMPAKEFNQTYTPLPTPINP